MGALTGDSRPPPLAGRSSKVLPICFLSACSEASINNRKVALVVCERAWESTHGNPGRMALCARGLSSTVENLPRQRAALQPAGSLRPDQQHQAVRVRCNGRMLSIGALAGRSQDWSDFAWILLDFLEVNLTRLFPRGKYFASPFAQICGTHGTGIQFPRVNARRSKRAAAVCRRQQGHVPMNALRRRAIENVQRVALVGDCAHPATPAGPQRCRRDRYFARKGLTVIGGPRHIHAPVLFSRLRAHGMPNNIHVAARIPSDGKSSVPPCRILHKSSLHSYSPTRILHSTKKTRNRARRAARLLVTKPDLVGSPV